MPPESGEEDEDVDFFFFSGVGGVRGSRSGIFDGMECTTIIVCWTRSTSIWLGLCFAQIYVVLVFAGYKRENEKGGRG